MTGLALAGAFALAVVGSALAGPRLIRGSAPLLVRVPRLAISVLAGSALLWPAAMFSAGPLGAWLLAGPTVLPTGATEVCQRCISAANPFGDVVGASPIPTVILLAGSAITAFVVTGAVLVQLRWRIRGMRVAASRVRGIRREIAGYEVTAVADERLLAFSFSASHGGIILSTGAIAALDESEVLAVLAHEQAHVNQRHHWILAIIKSVTAVLAFVPLVREAASVLPAYIEIAADNAAQKKAGTPAVVSALLTIGERSEDREGVLHIAGPERVQQLVAPVRGSAGAFPTAVMMSMVAVLAGVTACVLAPYSAALVAGCM